MCLSLEIFNQSKDIRSLHKFLSDFYQQQFPASVAMSCVPSVLAFDLFSFHSENSLSEYAEDKSVVERVDLSLFRYVAPSV